MSTAAGNDEEKFADEPGNDGRRQHKYTTADMKQSYPWKRWLLICLIFLLIIAIMIIITLLFQKLFDPPEEEDWTDSSDTNATGGIDDDMTGTSLLPKSLQYIEDACAENRLDVDRAACEEVCEPATECCDPYKAGNSTCFEEQESGCYTYAKCHSLNGFIDPAHMDLDRICAVAALEVNRDECELACESVACCFSAVDSCFSSNFQACLDYAACHNLKQNDPVEVAQPDLTERCEMGSPTCDRDCKEARCCSDSNSKCYRENFIACLSYSACTGNSVDTKVVVLPIYSQLDPPPENFDRICSQLGIDEDGPEGCLEACEPAKCCFNDDSYGCFGDDPLGCMAYQRCKIMDEPQNSGFTLPPSSTPATPVSETPAGDEDTTGGEEEVTEAPATLEPTPATADTNETTTATVSRTPAPSAGNSTSEEPASAPSAAEETGMPTAGDNAAGTA